MTTEVYIAEAGYDYDGSYLLGVCSTREKAIEVIKKELTERRNLLLNSLSDPTVLLSEEELFDLIPKDDVFDYYPGFFKNKEDNLDGVFLSISVMELL